MSSWEDFNASASYNMSSWEDFNASALPIDLPDRPKYMPISFSNLLARFQAAGDDSDEQFHIVVFSLEVREDFFGKDIREIKLREKYHLSLVALETSGGVYVGGSFAEIPLSVGCKLWVGFQHGTRNDEVKESIEKFLGYAPIDVELRILPLYTFDVSRVPSWIESSLLENQIRSKHGISVIGVSPGNTNSFIDWTLLPPADYVLQHRDNLLVLKPDFLRCEQVAREFRPSIQMTEQNNLFQIEVTQRLLISKKYSEPKTIGDFLVTLVPSRESFKKGKGSFKQTKGKCGINVKFLRDIEEIPETGYSVSIRGDISPWCSVDISRTEHWGNCPVTWNLLTALSNKNALLNEEIGGTSLCIIVEIVPKQGSTEVNNHNLQHLPAPSESLPTIAEAHPTTSE